MDQKITEPALQMMHSAAAEMPVSFIEIFCLDFSSCTEKNIFSHVPLRSEGIAIYIRNCVFLILAYSSLNNLEINCRTIGISFEVNHFILYT